MSIKQYAETRFVELMTELFQLDEAESLDFGIYRVIKRHNREVREFLGEIVTENEQKCLKGGRLSEILESSFVDANAETTADDKYRLIQLEKDLNLKPGMSPDEREVQLTTLEKIPATAHMVAEYRSRKEQMASASTAIGDRTEVLNRLFQFFARNYQDGDFIVERRYGRDGSRYIRSTGEDTEFHWATEEMYYIKSGDIFTDFPVKLSKGQRIVFAVESESLQRTRVELKPNDKAHYEFDKVTRDDDGQFRVCLKYLKNAQTDKQKEEIISAIQKVCGSDSAETKRCLNHFIARNQSDFFIHRRLKDALSEDLNIFIKTEILDADQLLADGDLPKRIVKVARIVKEVGGQIIDFLAALEDFQKCLWEKKKLVFETRYVITLDRIDKLTGRKWLESHIDMIIEMQHEEWKALGLGQFNNAMECRVEIPGDLLTQARTYYLPLPVDTGNFDDAFRWDLLENVTDVSGLDEALDGVIIHSDNWQALNTIQVKYRDRVKCCYIDPPYNTGTDGFPYKDAYQHASWMAMIASRLQVASHLLKATGVMFASIDVNEQLRLRMALDSAFSSSNFVEELIWAQSFTKNQSPTYSTNHEYVEVYTRDLSAAKAETSLFRINKPGAKELLAAIDKINESFPSIIEIEKCIADVFTLLDTKFREEVVENGLEWNEEIEARSPYKGIKNYKRAEYRDNSGRFVDEKYAAQQNAKIWIWYPTDVSMPGVSAGSKKAEVTDPNHPNFRFYTPIHQTTKRPCQPPTGGWRWPEKPLVGFTGSFEEKLADERIVWGKDETVGVLQKTFLHETLSQPAPSVMNEFSRGEKQISQLFGRIKNKGAFPNAKPSRLISSFIHQSSHTGDWVLDFFGGSGTTFHGALDAQILDGENRKTILVESADYIETVSLGRIKKISASLDWGKRGTGSRQSGKDGCANVINGLGVFLRFQKFEQYEDTLENLDADIEQQAQLPFDDPAFTLRYRLDRITRQVFSSIDQFTTPFGYKLKRSEGGGEAKSRQVDLVESLIYLLGLDVDRLYREPQGVVITGHDRRKRSVAVFFRDCTAADSAAWTDEKLSQHPADRVLTNDPASLTFAGCEQFEAIESIFTTQFGRA